MFGTINFSFFKKLYINSCELTYSVIFSLDILLTFSISFNILLLILINLVYVVSLFLIIKYLILFNNNIDCKISSEILILEIIPFVLFKFISVAEYNFVISIAYLFTFTRNSISFARNIFSDIS